MKIKILKAGNGSSKLLEAIGLFCMNPINIFIPSLQFPHHYEVILSGIDMETFVKIKEYIYINSTAE